MFKPFSKVICLLSLFSLPQFVLAHSDEEIPRYVAEHGKDTSLCESPFRPCKTLAYAASRAAKGDRVLVASGQYRVESAETIFYLTSGIVDITGGYNTYDHYAAQNPKKSPSLLLGVPVAFRALLEAKGFEVIVDRKMLNKKASKQADEMLKAYAFVQKSHAQADCVNGDAGGFTCDRIDLLSHVALNELGGTSSRANDIWGFVDLNTEREYVIIGHRSGTSVFDVDAPESPVLIGYVPGQDTVWRDIKVYQYFDTDAERWLAYAYVTADSAADRLRIIDLTQLPNKISLAGIETDEMRAHNVYIDNVDYSYGLSLDGQAPTLISAGSDLSSGGHRNYSLADPLQPELVAISPSGGYMHDGASFRVTGNEALSRCPGAATSCRILADFNERSVDLVDITDTSSPQLLDSFEYTQTGYTHSGWFSEDGRYLFVHDELDELNFSINTRLRVLDVVDFSTPFLASTWNGPTAAIDHNGFTRGNRYYMSNYTRGLTILDTTDMSNLTEVGYFDSFPSSNTNSFNGAWGVYPYLPSGTLAVSDINSGLYLLKDNTRVSNAGRFSFQAQVMAGQEGTQLVIDVDRVGGDSGAVSVDVQSLIASADAEDFQPINERLSWVDGESDPQSVTVMLNADASAEKLERFFLKLSSPQGGAVLDDTHIMTVFVEKPSAVAEVSFFQDSYQVALGQSDFLLPVQRRGVASNELTVDYVISGLTNEDIEQQLSWPAGDGTGRVIPVTIPDDAVVGDSVTIDLDTASNAAAIATAQAVVTVVDTLVTPPDPNPAPPPVTTPPPSSPPASSGGGSAPLLAMLLLILPILVRRRRQSTSAEH